MIFKELAIGQTFDFDYSRFSSTFHSIKPGPWVKISPRKYAKKGMECRIGSVECRVYAIELPKPNWEDCSFLA